MRKKLYPINKRSLLHLLLDIKVSIEVLYNDNYDYFATVCSIYRKPKRDNKVIVSTT